MPVFERLIWIVPLAVAVLGAWRPRAGLLVLVATLPLFGASEGGPYLAALEVAALAAIVTAWRGGRAEPSPLATAVAAFAAVSLFSLVPPAYQPPSWEPDMLLALLRALPGAQPWSAFYSWRAAADLAIGCLLFMAVRRAYGGRSLRPLALALLAGLSGTLLLGFAAHGGLISLDGYRPPLIVAQPVDHRLRSVFFASTRLGEYLVVAAPFALAALAGAGRWPARLLLPLSGVTLVGLALTLQRGAWGAAACQILSLAGVSGRRWRRDQALMRRAGLAAAMAALLVAGVVAVSALPSAPLGQRLRELDVGLAERVPLWAAALEMVRDRPLLGHGLGSWSPAYDELRAADRAATVPFHASGHQLYLQLAAERGVLGLFALGLLGCAVVLCLRRPRPGQEVLALGLGLSLLGAAVYGLVQNLFQLRINGWLIWILLGCIAAVGRSRPSLGIGRAALALTVAAVLVLPFRLPPQRWHRYAGNREFGFHEAEASGRGFQWTEGFAARRLPRTGDTLVLSLANGHPRGAQRPVTVTLGVDGRVAGRWTIAGGWEEHRIELGPARRQGEAVLSLQVEPTFRPFTDYQRHATLPPSRDHRLLGVAVAVPRWE